MPDSFDALFLNPPREYTLMPFWLFNDDLTETELRRQIDDFDAHGVYGFIPHVRVGLPESIGFMSEAFLKFVRFCVDYAASKDMTVILYDEGMYPSGSCAGQVVAANPRHAARCLVRLEKAPENIEPDQEIIARDDHYVYLHRRSMGVIRGPHYGYDDSDPKAPPAGDILNPEAVASFIHLVHDRFYDALKDHFGKTVTAMFTDEPNMLGRRPIENAKPWTWEFAAFFQQQAGYDLTPHLAALWDDNYPDAAKYRKDYEGALNTRLEQAYYIPCSNWCQDHGIQLTGHPSGPDDIGVMKHFQLPGQDIVWRYIEPYQEKSIEGEQSTQAKCSSAAQYHYGRKRNMNECFGAYGWELTYDEMIYVTNWLFVRGVNMLVPHAFYYSIREQRGDERPPDVGPNNKWWPTYKVYADYCRRMCWLNAAAKHVCHIAILGGPQDLPWRAARALFESQHDFNYIDTDTLRNCTITPTGIAIQQMTYSALVIDGAACLTPEVLALLKPLIDAGRVIAYRDEVPATRLAADPGQLIRLLDTLVYPDLVVTPATPALRYRHVQYGDQHLLLFVNEGPEPLTCKIYPATPIAPKRWLDPMTGLPAQDPPGETLTLNPLQTRILEC